VARISPRFLCGTAKPSAAPRCTGREPRRVSNPGKLRAKSTYGNIPGASLIELADFLRELKNYYTLAERRLGVTRRNGIPACPRQ